MANLNSIPDLSNTPSSNINYKGQSIRGTALASTIDSMFQNNASMLADLYDSLGGVATVSGTNTLTVTITEDWAAYASGLLLAIKTPNANTGAVTLNVTVPTAGALGAKAIRRQGDSALSANDMVANGVYLLRYASSYNSSAGAWVLLNAAGGTTYTGNSPISVSGSTISLLTSGQSLASFTPYDNEPPSSNYATLSLRNGHPTLQFDDTTSWAAIFTGVLPRRYGGGGLTVYIHASAVATSGTMGWLVAIERMDDSSTDFDSDSFASNVTVTAATVPGTSGQTLVLNAVFSSGAAMDSLAAGEAFRLKIARDVANDTAVGNVEIMSVEVKET